MVTMILGHLSRMFKKVAQRGRSERGGEGVLFSVR
jgi:hypothetical protein